MTTRKVVCNFQSHADLIATLRAEGKFGPRLCPHCGRTIQAGSERCPHSSLIDGKGRTLCESCKAGPIDSRTHHVSQEQVNAFLKDTPAIPDTELQAHEPPQETESVDTNLLNCEVI